ncbi:hypothetical protein OHB05_01110 [Streptomyces sp. NBC_00638]|uniref:hypothetical protein n=1 Tax=unclassified Streptomyces TaxID=2593676 RepID=UPI00225A0D19|nr:hypothetical protein [Streptomyces sp. NBC_00638]MCX5001229.1 hypothetical protein [Streptomyces sp. NBC_00638]
MGESGRYLELLNEFRSAAFHQHHWYITNRLAAEHDPDLGVSGLPSEAQEAIYDVAFFLHNFVVLRRCSSPMDRAASTPRSRPAAGVPAVAFPCIAGVSKIAYATATALRLQ